MSTTIDGMATMHAGRPDDEAALWSWYAVVLPSVTSRPSTEGGAAGSRHGVQGGIVAPPSEVFRVMTSIPVEAPTEPKTRHWRQRGPIDRCAPAHQATRPHFLVSTHMAWPAAFGFPQCSLRLRYV